MIDTNQKSPSAPSHSLEQCLNAAIKIYNSYSHSSFGDVDIATALNMSNGGGAYNSWVADLKQYNLIQKTGSKSFNVTQTVKDYCTLQYENPSEAIAMRGDLLKNPPFFEKFISSLHGRLPELNSLTNILMSQYMFNKSKAKKTARALTESLIWAEVLDEKRNIVFNRTHQQKAIDDQRAQTTTNTNNANNADEHRAENVAPASTTPTQDSSASLSNLKMQLPLCNNRTCEISYPSDLSSEEAKMISAVFDAITKSNTATV